MERSVGKKYENKGTEEVGDTLNTAHNTIEDIRGIKVGNRSQEEDKLSTTDSSSSSCAFSGPLNC